MSASSDGLPRQGRAYALDRLSSGPLDLLVVGGGIVGARVACEAARAGLRVGLAEAGDFGGATSGASSKLVHGGLRYLATGDLRLVRRCQRERSLLAGAVAPHLVRPLPVLLALRRSSRQHARFRLAMALYSALAGFEGQRPRRLTAEEGAALVPRLRTEAVHACALLPEAQTHDSRLTLATVRAAANAGAVVSNYLRVTAFEHSRGRLSGAVLADVIGRDSLVVRARAVVNATGPWVDAVRRLDDPAATSLARLSKGVHVLLPLEGGWRAGLALYDETATLLAAPWQGMLLLGATDTEYSGDAEAAVADEDDVARLLRSFEGIVPAESLCPGRVRMTFAGLRVLPPGGGATASASRGHRLEVSRGGMISVFGGKLTTHRWIAVDVLRRLPAELRPRLHRPSNEPLPGGLPIDPRTLHEQVDADVGDHLLHLYGSEAPDVLAYGEAELDGLDRIHPRGPDIWAQAYFALDREWGTTVDDIAARRTTLAVRGLADDDVRTRLSALLRSRHAWIRTSRREQPFV